MVPTIRRYSMKTGHEHCNCEHTLGHTCNVCRSDLVILLVEIGVPLRIAKSFIHTEVGHVEVIS